MQQRSIPPRAIQLLQDYGAVRYDHRGGIVYSFDKHSRRRLESEVGRREVARLAKYLDTYLVASVDGHTVITVAHRYEGRRARRRRSQTTPGTVF
jgi:hypothetical protein